MGKNITDFIDDLSKAENAEEVYKVLNAPLFLDYGQIDLESPDQAEKYYESYIDALDRLLGDEFQDLRPVLCGSLVAAVSSLIRANVSLSADKAADMRDMLMKLTSLSGKLYKTTAECKLWGMMDVRNTFERLNDPEMGVKSEEIERLYSLSVDFMNSELVGKGDEYQILGISAIAKKAGIESVDTEEWVTLFLSKYDDDEQSEGMVDGAVAVGHSNKEFAQELFYRAVDLSSNSEDFKYLNKQARTYFPKGDHPEFSKELKKKVDAKKKSLK